eukprot:COSAG03_NODE_4270_length_1614_cov_1.907591_2_plen_114_part_00
MTELSSPRADADAPLPPPPPAATAACGEAKPAAGRRAEASRRSLRASLRSRLTRASQPRAGAPVRQYERLPRTNPSAGAQELIGAAAADECLSAGRHRRGPFPKLWEHLSSQQ